VNCFFHFSARALDRLPPLPARPSGSTESRRDGSPLRQTGKTSAGSPAHRARQRQTETAGAQENHSSGPTSPQDAHQPPTNGTLAQMERDEEEVKVDTPEERTDGSVRLEADGLVNGDAEQTADPSPPRTPETHSASDKEDAGTQILSEHGAEEGSPDQKVRRLRCPRTRVICVFTPSVVFMYSCLVSMELRSGLSAP